MTVSPLIAVILATALLITLLAIGLAWHQVRRGRATQRLLLDTLQRMGEGDLAGSVPASLQDDALGAALQQALGSQRELLRGLRQPFESLVAELYRIGKQNRTQTTAVAQLARQLQEVAAVQAESRRALDNLADSSQRAADVAPGHQQGVRRSHNLVRDMTRAAGELRQSLQQTSKTAKRQGELIQSVTSAAEYIQGLNTRVSVVAINTRIEAERAGEQGRPLLGIAEALSDLLRESEGEGRRIAGDIRMLQSQSAESLGSLENTVSAVVTILEYVDRLDGTLEQTVQSASELQGLLGQFQEAASGTLRASRQMQGDAGELPAQVGEVTEQCEQLRQGITQMQQNLSTLGRALSRLRLEETPAAAVPPGEAGADTGAGGVVP